MIIVKRMFTINTTVYNLVIILIIHYSCKINISILYFMGYYVSLFLKIHDVTMVTDDDLREKWQRDSLPILLSSLWIIWIGFVFVYLLFRKITPKVDMTTEKSWDAIMIKCDMFNVYPQIISLFLSPDILQILSWKNQYGAWMKIQRRNWKFAIFHDLI